MSIWWSPLGRRAFFLLLFHVALWTVLPLALTRNLPLDVVEALSWGREWQWGYYKHPPLAGWLAELARFGPHDWPLYLLAQAMVGTALVANWLLARDVLRTVAPGGTPLTEAGIERLALCAALATEGVHYYSASSIEFNANVVMYPFWAWAGLCFWRAIHAPARGAVPGWPWWLGLGLCTGLGMLGKYVFVLLPASMLLSTLCVAPLRALWRRPGPWLAMGVALLVFAPHLLWAVTNDWPTLRYAFGRGQSAEACAPSALCSGGLGCFVLTQVLVLLPLVALMALLGRPRRVSLPRADAVAALAMALGPFLLLMTAAGVSNARVLQAWATPFFVSAGVWWLVFLRPAGEPNWRRFGAGVGLWVGVLVLVYACVQVWGPARKHRLDRTAFPGRELASVVEACWHEETGRPLAIVSGDNFAASSLAHYAASRPSAFIDFDFGKSPWLDEARVRRDGVVFVWPLSHGDGPGSPQRARHYREFEEDMAAIRVRYPKVVRQPDMVLPVTWQGKVYPVVVAWALLPPEDVPALRGAASCRTPATATAASPVPVSRFPDPS